MALARCFVGLSHKQLLQVKAWLLCQLAQKKSSPVVPSNPLNNGLLAYWKMDEDTGTTTADSTGNGNTGTFSGTGASWVTGKINSGLAPDKDTGYVDFGVIYGVAGLTQASFSVWVNVTLSGVVAVTDYNGGVGGNYYNWDVAALSGVCYARLYNGTTNPNLHFPCPASGWHLFTVVYDGTQSVNTNRLLVYIDGVLATGVTYIGTFPASLPILSNLSHATIGSSADFTHTNGTYDEFGIWSRVLTQADVTSLWNGGAGIQLPV
jgi:hypothetical protein